LALLTPAVLSRVNESVDDRQWVDGDVRQICSKDCITDCTDCTPNNQCDPETEIKCGSEPQTHSEYEWIILCPEHDICVPKHCECVTNDCPMICEVTCEDDELLCTSGTDPVTGCKENDFCHPKGTGSTGQTCPGFCPFECTEEEHRCPVPDDPITGCAVPPLCIPKSKDVNDNDCDEQHCPIVCDESSQECLGGKDHLGCPEADICVPKCVEECPVTCGDEEIKCKGTNDCTTNCVDRDTCKPLVPDVNGEACPADSGSHGCPIQCCAPDIVCPGEKDAVGCLEPSTCESTSTGMDGATCPEHSDCPTICEPYEVKCPNDNVDANNCKLKDHCIKQERDYDGELCTVHCPKECNDNEVHCPGLRNEMGCFEEDQCITRAIKTKGSDAGGLCPGWCPPLCLHGEIKCPSQVDPCDGCPTEEICVDAATSVDNEFCSTDPVSFSASHGCPKICDYTIGKVACAPADNPTGCLGPVECYQRPETSRSTADVKEWCPEHSVCPSNCASDEIACNYGIDERGCQEATLCRPKGRDLDDELCPGVCPPTCLASEILTSSGTDNKGCELASTCQPA